MISGKRVLERSGRVAREKRKITRYYVQHSVRGETGQRNSVTDADERRPLRPDKRSHVRIPSNFLPAPFIPLSPVS